MSGDSISPVVFWAKHEWSTAEPITQSEHRPTDHQMAKYFKVGGKEWTSASTNTIHWCGLFSLWVLKRAAVTCYWNGSIVPVGGQLVHHPMPFNIKQFPGVHMGDVAVRKDDVGKEHYIIIAQEVPPGKHSYSIWAIDGNSTGDPTNPRVRFSNNWKHTTERFLHWWSVEF
jgi:hypothetical protein